MIETHFLHRFFNPKSVAIIGASQNTSSVNHHLVNNLINIGYKGKIFPVNPNAESIFGIKAYNNVNEIQENIDLVVISIPARSVLEIIQNLPYEKIGGVALITGGFSEIGAEGKQIQDEIAKILKKNGIRAIGPNALSPINSRQNFIISFFNLKKLPVGNVSFIFQSGMYEPRFSWILSDFHLGISKLIDLGNKMDVTEVDALEYLSQDPETKVICMHLEAVKGNGRKFVEILKETTRRKPVIVLKGGRTEAGAQVAMSHTGSLAHGGNIVFDSVLKQTGAIRADTLDDFLYFAKAFSYLPILPRGNRIAIATFPGGEAVLTADLCSQNGLAMARPGQASYERLKRLFPPWEVPLNPFDFGIIYSFNASTNNYHIYIESMLDDENVDCLAVQLPPLTFPIKPDDFYPPFLKAKEKGKPIALWPPHMLKLDGDVIKYLEKNSVPVFPSAAITIKCLAALNNYRLYLADF